MARHSYRAHAQKKEVVIYDYVDDQHPVLAKMARKRIKGYANLGYVINTWSISQKSFFD